MNVLRSQIQIAPVVSRYRSQRLDVGAPAGVQARGSPSAPDRHLQKHHDIGEYDSSTRAPCIHTATVTIREQLLFRPNRRSSDFINPFIRAAVESDGDTMHIYRRAGQPRLYVFLARASGPRCIAIFIPGREKK